jgi:hypothetical protein
MKQTTNSILMVRPVAFRMNEQTAVNNYQKSIRRSLPATVNAKAQEEFDTFVEKLRAVGVDVTVVDDTLNRIPRCFQTTGFLSMKMDAALYPMFAANRRSGVGRKFWIC